MKSLRLYASLVLTFCVAAVVCSAQDSPLRVLDIPKPALPADYGTFCARGAVRLKVTFLDDGTIDRVFPITRMPGLTQLALDATQRIKFAPKVVDGPPTNVDRTIEYFYGPPGGWSVPSNLLPDPKADAIIQKAIQFLGGEKYLNVKTQIAKGKYSILRDGGVASFQTFSDVIVYPDKERTDFKGGGTKSTQTNVGNTGWVYDGDQELVKEQNEKQIEGYKRGIRTSLDFLLRGYWKGDAELSYIGTRQGTLGKRNDTIKLTYKDGLEVEFGFADDGTPVNGSYKRLNAEGEEVKEEDRYAQFIDVGGIKAPFIIDRFTAGTQSSRINYETIEFNKAVSDSIFKKPSSGKEAKKDPKP